MGINNSAKCQAGRNQAQVLDATHNLNPLDINHTYKLTREGSKEQNEDGNRNLSCVGCGIHEVPFQFPRQLQLHLQIQESVTITLPLRSVLVQSLVKSL